MLREILWIGGIPLWCIWIVSRRDTEWSAPTGKVVVCYLPLLGIHAAAVHHIVMRYGWQGTVGEKLLSVFAGCIVFACITDHMACQVYHFIWWPAWGAGLGLLLTQDDVRSGLLLESEICDVWQVGVRLAQLLLFILLQELWFCRMYGRADCHAFVACAMVECALGDGLREYLVHMAATFGVLALVQLCRGNVDHRGNLKKPVALLPYLAADLCGMLMMR